MCVLQNIPLSAVRVVRCRPCLTPVPRGSRLTCAPPVLSPEDPLKQLKDLNQLKTQLEDIQRRVENQVSIGVPQVSRPDAVPHKSFFWRGRGGDLTSPDLT